MLIRRRTRLITALFALISLLFMQLALANYVCPIASSKVAETAAMPQASMPCAQFMAVNMDYAQPNLCKAHCQGNQQSADTYKLPPPAAATIASAFFPPPATAPIAVGLPLQTPLLRRSTAPALSVRNCCFRI